MWVEVGGRGVGVELGGAVGGGNGAGVGVVDTARVLHATPTPEVVVTI